MQAHPPTPTLVFSGGASLPTAPLPQLSDPCACPIACVLLGLQGPRVSSIFLGKTEKTPALESSRHVFESPPLHFLAVVILSWWLHLSEPWLVCEGQTR